MNPWGRVSRFLLLAAEHSPIHKQHSVPIMQCEGEFTVAKFTIP